jgi:hypothetical protein
LPNRYTRYVVGAQFIEPYGGLDKSSPYNRDTVSKGGGLACLPVGRGEGEALQNKAYLIIEYRVYPIYTLSWKG